MAGVQALPDQRRGVTLAPRRPAGLAVALGLVLGVVAPAYLLAGSTVPFEAAWAVQVLCVLVSGAGIAAVVTTDRLRPMQLAFWVFSYVWMGVAPLAMLTRDTYPWPLRAEADVSFRSSVVVLVGLVTYAVVLVASGQAAVARPPSSAPRPPRVLDWQRSLALGGVALVLGVLLVPRLGGAGSFFASREASNDAAAAATGSSGGAGAALLGWGLSVPAFWALLALWKAPFPTGGPRWAAHSLRVLRTARWGLLALVVLLNLVVNNPISQPRYWAGTVLIAVVLCSRRLASVRAFRAAALGLLVAVVVVFPSADYFRYDSHSIPKVGVVQQLMTNPDYDAYQQLQGAVMMVDDTGHHPDWALALPFFWVPRAVWPDKPRDAGPQIAEHVGYDFTNLSSPLWSESYLWGGLGVVVLTFAGLGLLSGRLDVAYDRARRGGRGALMGTMVPPLAMYQFIVLRGSLLQAMAALSLLLVIPLLISRRPATGRTSPLAVPAQPAPTKESLHP